MAQLNSRGTLTRSRWDYFERTNGWALVWGSVTSGQIGAYFANSATGTIQLDLYHVTWFASIAAVWGVIIIPPPLITTPLTPTETEIHACQPDAATPPGVVGMYTTSPTFFYTVQRNSNQSNSGTLSPISGLPFITLPPGWAIAVSGNDNNPNPCELSMNVWFQETLDNVAPAV